MRIAILNTFFGQPVAEKELARRMCLAAKNIGWEAIEVGSSLDVNAYAPDAVFVMHHFTPKLTGYPTYGCMWNPLEYFEEKKDLANNILGYDGFLCASEDIELWIRDRFYFSPKKFEIIPFFTSCNAAPYQAPNVTNPRLAYVGSNWDVTRFQDLFVELDKQDYMEFYGNPDGWRYLQQSYKGLIPFDGVSLLKTLNQAGVGLCLHLQEHTNSKVASMRIFEIVASGAIAICGEHDFIKKQFGNTVFYLKNGLTAREQTEQITEYLHWIRNNPKAALEMSVEAHRIFTDKFTLEQLLKDFEPYHQRLCHAKGFPPIQYAEPQSAKPVQLIVRVGGRPTSVIKRSLDSIADQTYPNVEPILVQYKSVDGLDELLQQYQGRFQAKVLSTPPGCSHRSTSLWTGLNAVTSDYFGILDDDDRIHPNHVHTLVSLLEENPDYGIAYSGSIVIWESDIPGQELPRSPYNSEVIEPAATKLFHHFELVKMLRYDNFINSNAYIVRRSLLNPEILKDPLMEVSEDFFLLLYFCLKTRFLFSSDATCEIFWRTSKQDNSTFQDDELWLNGARRITRAFSNLEFPLAMTIDFLRSQNNSPQTDSHLQELQRLQQELEQYKRESQRLHSKLRLCEQELGNARGMIEAMETSKFWKIRKAWFQVKKTLGLRGD